MLICPQCESENSDDKSLCSVCQTALTDNLGDRSDLQTPSLSEYFINFNSSSSARLALIYPSLHTEVRAEAIDIWQHREYLDSHSRYRIDSPIGENLDGAESECIAIAFTDTRPSEQPFLQELLARDNSPNEQNANIPQIALPYLKAVDAAIPQIYDAWLENDAPIIILEDRFNWQKLADFVAKPDLSCWQLLYWFDKTAQLWNGLKQLGVVSSLIVEENFCLDEDDRLCLQQLHYDGAENGFALSHLGLVWKSLLTKSQIILPESFNQLLDCLISGQVQTAEKLRSSLHDIIVEIETETESDSGPPTNILPIQLTDLRDFALTDVGLQRESNEDFFGIYTAIEKHHNSQQKKISARGLYIVCDGMGGHDAGEVASAMAVDILQDYFQDIWLQGLPDRETIRKGIHLANETIYRENINNSSSGVGRMGTTLAMLLLQDNHLAIASVGDSRIYRLTARFGLEQLTSDHQIAQLEIKRGVDPEIAYALPNARQLTQALGPRDNNFVEPAIEFLELQQDCLLLLCSDGLSDNQILEQNWQKYLKPLLESDLDLDVAMEDLIDLANQENGHDNITAIAVKVKVGVDLKCSSTGELLV